MPTEKQRRVERVEILKLPLGSDVFTQQCLHKRVEQMASVLSRLDLLDDSHIKFTILRASLSAARLTYALRPPWDAGIAYSCRRNAGS